MTLEKMVKLDPRIGALLAEAPGNYWYGPGELREQVQNLAGWLRDGGPYELETAAAYDLLYQAAYKLSNGRRAPRANRLKRAPLRAEEIELVKMVDIEVSSPRLRKRRASEIPEVRHAS